MFTAIGNTSIVVSVTTNDNEKFELTLPYGINFEYKSNSSG